MPDVRQRRSVTFKYGFFEVFAYDLSFADSEAAADDIQRAIEEGVGAERSVGLAGSAAVLFMPEQYSNDVSLEVVEYGAEPPLALDGVDVCVEFDLELPTGRLGFEEPANEPVPVVDVAPGRYRLRWYGMGYDGLPAWRDAHGEDEDADLPNPDRYRLELWPAARPAPPLQHRGQGNTGT